MSQKQIFQVFDQYQRARLQFVQTISNIANRSQNVDALIKCEVLVLLKPLLTDPLPTINQIAANTVGKISSYSELVAQRVIGADILPTLILSPGMQNRFYKRAFAYTILSIGKHSSELAKSVVNTGALDTINVFLEEYDISVKENALLSISSIARHNEDLAQSIVDSGSLPLILYNFQESDINLRRVACIALGDIAKHSISLTQSVIDVSGILHLSRQTITTCPKLKKHAFTALASIAKHIPDFAALVVESEIFPQLITSLQDKDMGLQRECANLIKEICKHTYELCQLIANNGGISALVSFIQASKRSVCLPGILALGYISAHSDALAAWTIKSLGLVQLKSILLEDQDNTIKSACVWSIGQIGRHSSSHARAVAETELLPVILSFYLNNDSTDELKDKSKNCLKQVLEKCVYLPALLSLLHGSPPSILKYIVAQFSKILPRDAKARREFVVSGSLRKIQEMNPDKGTPIYEHITAINNCFPEDVVRFYTPGYSDVLLERVETYKQPV